MYRFLMSGFILVGCVASPSGLEKKPIDISSSSITIPSASPCTDNCRVIDARVHQKLTSPTACAGDQITVELSNLYNSGLSKGDEVALVMVFNPNLGHIPTRDTGNGIPDRGVPPLPNSSLTLTTGKVSDQGHSKLSVKLKMTYGPDEQGHKINLEKKESNGLIYIHHGEGRFTRLDMDLCSA